MDESISDVVDVVVTGRESEVRLLINPHSQGIPICHKNPLSDVKLSTLNNQRVLHVFLSNKLRFLLLTEIQNLDQLLIQDDASPSR